MHYKLINLIYEEVGLDNYNPPKQEHLSGGTSLNQVPAGMKKINWIPGTVNLDWGGGKYDTATKYLEERGVKNYVYDINNRTPEENKIALNCDPDTITCFNVFNVIKEDEVINYILEYWKDNYPTAKTIYITAYIKKRRPRGKTPKGWQRHQALTEYLPLIKNVFPQALIKNGMIIINK